MCEFYNGLLSSSVNREATINLQELNIAFASHNLELRSEEVWMTICQLLSDKGHGPGGLWGVSIKFVGPLSRMISWQQFLLYRG